MRTILTLLLLCLCGLGAAESLTISFTPQDPAGAGRWAKHCVAVWVETGAAAFVKTIADWSQAQRSDLTQWRAKAGTGDTDAIMGATLNVAGALSSGAWAMNSRASPAATVADGAYRIWLECVDDSTPVAGTGNVTWANRLGVPFQKDGVSRSAVPYTDPAGKFTAITYSYTGRVPGIANPALAITAGSATTFTLTNNAAVAPIGYQWRKGGTNIGGATSSTYTIAAAVPTDAGSYACVVTYPNSYGLAAAPSMTSNALGLLVSSGTIAATAAAITPAASTVNPGAAVTLTSTVTPADATSPTYAWYSNASNSTSGGTLLAGAGASTYSPPTAMAGTRWYYGTVTAGGATVTATGAVAVTVRAAPTISAHPAASTVAGGGTAGFTITAGDAGFPTLNYQWQALPPGGSWTAIGGATTSAYSTTSLVDATQYRCLVTNASGAGVTTTSGAATLSVVEAPTITADTSPLDPAVIGGSSISLTVAGTVPAGTLGYQWQRRASATGAFANVGGATASTYAATATSDGEQFRCLLINTRNGVTATTISRVTTCTVAAPAAPTFTSQPASVTVFAGATASFTVAVSGVPTPTLQWSDSPDGFTFTPIAGATAAICITAATAAGDVGVPRSYRCTASNGSGTVTSTVATRTVTGGAPSGIAYINFTSSSAGGSYAPKHVMAAWIQRGPTFIATLGDWSGERKVNLTLWHSVSGGTDAVMGATRLSHRQVGNLVWNFLPATTPDGAYALWLESADANIPAGDTTTTPIAGSNRTRFDFTVVGGAVVEAVGSGGGFSCIRISPFSDPTAAAAAAAAASTAAQNGGQVARCGSGGLFALICAIGLLLALRRRRG